MKINISTFKRLNRSLKKHKMIIDLASSLNSQYMDHYMVKRMIKTLEKDALAVNCKCDSGQMGGCDYHSDECGGMNYCYRCRQPYFLINK